MVIDNSERRAEKWEKKDQLLGRQKVVVGKGREFGTGKFPRVIWGLVWIYWWLSGVELNLYTFISWGEER